MKFSSRSRRFPTFAILGLWTLVSVAALAGCGKADSNSDARQDDAPTPSDTVNALAESSPEPSSEATELTAIEETVAELSDTEQSQASALNLSRSNALLAALTIFMLAIFVGFELITKVPPTLHTPLMSGSNAISGITVVGALLMAGNDQSLWAAFFGMLAVAMAMVNVVGGFMVTDRMLSMFRKK